MTPRHWGLALACALAVGANIQALGNRFAMDDEFIVLRNERVQELGNPLEAFAQQYWPETTGRLAMYRPVTIGALAVQWDAWQDRPVGYHAVNLLLHVAVTGMVFILLAGLTPGVGPALAGAAIFAVHPVHVEAVASVIGLGEILAAVFVLLACLVYLKGDRGTVTALAIGLLYFLALGSKEIGATLPGLLLLLETTREAKGSGAGGGRSWLHAWLVRSAQRWRIYLATVIGLAGYVALRIMALGTAVGSAEASFFQGLGGAGQLMTAVSLWPEYLRLLVFPVDLVADYSPGVLSPVTELGPSVWAGAVVGALALGLVVLAWSRVRSVAVGVVWFIVAILPVSNLIIPIGVLLAERTLYLPSVGLALTTAGLVGWAFARAPAWRPILTVGMSMLVGLAGVRTWLRTPEWRDTPTIIQTLARNHPESFRVQWLMASQLRSQGRQEQALERYRTAVDLVPGHFQLQIEYGRAALDAGRYQEAIQSLQVARDAVPDLVEGHVFLMSALIRAGRSAEAVAAGREALRWHPEHRGVHHQLAIALGQTRDFAAALEARRTSIRLAGERAAWLQFVHEAELLLRLGRPADALTALSRARGRAEDPTVVPSLDTLSRAIETANEAVLPYR